MKKELVFTRQNQTIIMSKNAVNFQYEQYSYRIYSGEYFIISATEKNLRIYPFKTGNTFM